MRSRFISRLNDAKRLIVIYAGWGMDWRPFANLEHDGYDIMVVWDYRDLTFNWSPYLRYDEICLLAWSMGVFAASVTMHEIEPRVTMRIAINGTLQPIDDYHGIPPAIWTGTMNALSPSTWRKFQRRMCDTKTQFEEFKENAPKRTIADLLEELVSLETHSIFHTEQITDWDLAIVSKHDAIFPAANQLRAWNKIAPTRVLEAGHLPDFKQLIERLFKDKNRLMERFNRASATYADSAVVQRDIALKLMSLFDSKHGSSEIVGNVIEIGPGIGGMLTRLWYNRTDPRGKLMLWDLIDVDFQEFAPRAAFERCDAEARIKRQPSDSARYIFSSSTIQWFNSPREFLKECSRVLVEGGYLVLSSFAYGNLSELTSITGNGLQLPPVKDWRTMIPASFEVLDMLDEYKTLTFDTPREVLEHLRDTGVNSVRYGRSDIAVVRRILRDYPRALDTGLYNLTYHPIYLVLRKIETS